MTERGHKLDIRDITPARCDVSTRCDISVRAERDKRRLKQNPGITITTDAEKVAAILGTPPPQNNGISHNPDWAIVEPVRKAQENATLGRREGIYDASTGWTFAPTMEPVRIASNEIPIYERVR